MAQVEQSGHAELAAFLVARFAFLWPALPPPPPPTVGSSSSEAGLLPAGGAAGKGTRGDRGGGRRQRVGGNGASSGCDKDSGAGSSQHLPNPFSTLSPSVSETGYSPAVLGGEEGKGGAQGPAVIVTSGSSRQRQRQVKQQQQQRMLQQELKQKPRLVVQEVRNETMRQQRKLKQQVNQQQRRVWHQELKQQEKELAKVSLKFIAACRTGKFFFASKRDYIQMSNNSIYLIQHNLNTILCPHPLIW